MTAAITITLGLTTAEHGHGQTPDGPDTSICYKPGGIAAWVTAVAVTVWPLLAWLFLRAKLAAFFDPFSSFLDP